MKKTLFRYLAVIMIGLILLSGCSSKSLEDSVQSAGAESLETNNQSLIADGKPEIIETRKLIRTVNMTIETNKFDKSLEQINTILLNTGGYIQNSQISGNRYGSQDNRSAYLVVRVPNEKLSWFLEKTTDLGNVIDKSENIEDVTTQYTDTQARLTSLKTEFDRLLVLIDKAEKLEDIIKLEERLSQVRYQMDSLTAQLKIIDNEVDFSTVSMELYEVNLFTPSEDNNISQRIGTGFRESLLNIYIIMQSVIVVTISLLPYFFVTALILIIVLFVYRKINRKIKNKKIDKLGDGNE
ncbi:DUF4349 domain-containing protein [Proteocatella sphenisci]|uniref:DUF4349 domain-containing protein n=1 Tax=Proteocatella sphenisci TaxID=181070 RepID=UPI0004AC5704|nr:DUF4349 domain-containing protein [Proteocatella sphenisci]